MSILRKIKQAEMTKILMWITYGLLIVAVAVLYLQEHQERKRRAAQHPIISFCGHCWFPYVSGRLPGVEVFSSPRPARKFVKWQGTLFCATEGGLFPVEDNSLGRPITVADGFPSHKIYDAFLWKDNLYLFTDMGLSVIGKETEKIQTLLSPNRRKYRAFIAFRDVDLICPPYDKPPQLTSRIVYVFGNDIHCKDFNYQVWGYDTAGNVLRVIAAHAETVAHIDAVIYDIASYEGNLLFATSSGLLVFSPSQKTVVDSIATAEPTVTMVKVCGDTIFAGGLWGVDVILRKKRTRTIKVPLDWGAVRDIAALHGKHILCGDGGVIDEFGHRLDEGLLPENKITAITFYRGTMWAGTFSSGVVHLDGDFWRREDFGGSNFINSLVTDGVHLWAGTDDGLVMLRPARRIFTRRDGLNSNSISCLFWDGENLWAGTNRGVCVLKYFGWKQYYVRDGLCGDHIYGIGGTPGEIWVGAYGGVSRISPAGNRCWRRVDGALKNDWVTAVAVCEDGVFVGTYGGGISRFHDGKWTHYAPGRYINPDAVTLFRGMPVFGTAGNGILVWNGVDFVGYNLFRDFPALEVLSLYADDTYIYVGTTEGIVKVRFADEPAEL